MLALPPDEQIAAETSIDDVEVSANEDVNIASCEVRLVGWLVTRSASPNDRPTSLEASQCRKSNTIFSYFVGLGDQVYMGRLCIPFNPPQRGNSLKYFTEGLQNCSQKSSMIADSNIIAKMLFGCRKDAQYVSQP